MENRDEVCGTSSLWPTRLTNFQIHHPQHQLMMQQLLTDHLISDRSLNHHPNLSISPCEKHCLILIESHLWE
jgi:hypothetical protein